MAGRNSLTLKLLPEIDCFCSCVVKVFLCFFRRGCEKADNHGHHKCACKGDKHVVDNAVQRGGFDLFCRGKDLTFLSPTEERGEVLERENLPKYRQGEACHHTSDHTCTGQAFPKERQD